MKCEQCYWADNCPEYGEEFQMNLTAVECEVLREFIDGYYMAQDADDKADSAAMIVGILDYLLSVTVKMKEACE